jgi:SulP family sulfate permease
MSAPALIGLLRREFHRYGRADVQADLLAGLTVAAVALPLALAFGVASGADAAAGLVTAILAGLFMGVFGGAPYQISGPTGAMSAVLIVVATRHGLPAVWVAGAMAGVLIFLVGLFRLGRLVSYIPSPVITGFTSGIALIIAIGQIDNVLGVKTGGEGVLGKLAAYAQESYVVNPRSVATAAVVAGVMVAFPFLTRRVPGSLVGIVVATGLVVALGWDVPTIGAVPRGILLDQRMGLGDLSPELMRDLLVPALSIAALGAIETLLCGAVAGNMTGVKMDNNQELMAQGLGNVLIPFFGGVPATAAIARTSVGVKSGGRTRLVSVVHGLALLLIALVAGPLIARVPLAALGGVLMVTAYRMNEWETIRFFVHRHLRHALVAMAVTMIATVVLDLTQAIIIGVAVSAVAFVRQASALAVSREVVSSDRMRQRGHDFVDAHDHVQVIYVAGPLFFGSVNAFLESLEGVSASDTVILSMRGVPMVDAMAVQAIDEVIDRQQRGGGAVHLTGLQDAVHARLARARILDRLGPDRVHWSADQAILAAHRAVSPAGDASPGGADAAGGVSGAASPKPTST